MTAFYQRFETEEEILKTFALLGYHFNSFHQQKITAKNLLTDNEKALTAVCQFIPPSRRFPGKKIDVGHWQIPFSEIFKIIPDLASMQIFSDDRRVFDFYFPLKLSPEYHDLLKHLGQPKDILEGVMTTSGRSLWVFGAAKGPFCLKIDTMQLSEKRGFSERSLLESGLRHSANLTTHLQKQENIFDEFEGVNLVFKFFYKDNIPKRYTYLIRRLDFQKTGIKEGDKLLPVTTLMSDLFWKNTELVSALGLTGRSAADILEKEFIRLFADLIRNSLDTTFFHYEVHQQNLSLVIREGSGVKLLYHDLEDSLFDPVTYFLQRIRECGWADISSIHQELQHLKRPDSLEDQGYLVLSGLDNAYNNVTSYYRRHIRNFGLYTRSFNFFKQHDYIAARDFEKLLLEHLAFPAEDIAFDERVHSGDLKDDLFWNIDRYHINKQRKLLTACILQFIAENRRGTPVSAEKLLEIISEDTTFVSVDFPAHFDQINPQDLSDFHDLYNECIFYGHYRGLQVCLIRPIKKPGPGWVPL